MSPLVSVIVPIYMIDRYVGICIESIINQSYSNLEIILVDDGSKDRCSEICDLYARKDSRIKVIHKPNGGLVSARKAGLRESNGAYVSYVDGDDWIDSGFIESLLASARASGADMVCAGFTRDLFSKSACFTNVLPVGVYEGERLRDLWTNMLSTGDFYQLGISTYVWNKLFKREVLLASQMPVDERIGIGEDGAVTYPALQTCQTVSVIGNTDYHYRQREDSMLKQNAVYSSEALRLRYLHKYLMRWAESTDDALMLKSQITDYVLSIALMRSGGRLPQDEYSTFDPAYYSSDVVIYSAGTFGQQLVSRFRETQHCKIVGWVDDDYWEYRRCGLDVDPVEAIASITYDYILLATVDSSVARRIKARLRRLGVQQDQVLTVTVPDAKEQLLHRFLDVDAIRDEEANRKRETMSHA